MSSELSATEPGNLDGSINHHHRGEAHLPQRGSLLAREGLGRNHRKSRELSVTEP